MTTKEKVRSLIDEVPEHTLQAVETLLQQIADAENDDYISDADFAVMDARYEEYLKDPSVGTEFEDYLAGK
jgi:hypothetical protein